MNAVLIFLIGGIFGSVMIAIISIASIDDPYHSEEFEIRERRKGYWRPISEYDPKKHDWILLKIIDADGCELLPYVAKMRNDGSWENHGVLEFEKIPILPGSKIYFFDTRCLRNR